MALQIRIRSGNGCRKWHAAAPNATDPLDRSRRTGGAERQERGGQLSHVWIALGRIFLETTLHDAAEALGYVGPQLVRELGRLQHDLHADGRYAGAIERRLAGQKLVEADPNPPNVGALVDMLGAPDLLR